MPTPVEVHTPDAELLHRYIARRDEDAFEALVRVHGPMVLGVCRRILGNHHDAEDAFQATFLVLAHRAAAISPKSMVGNWLYGVAYRTALKAKAERAKRREWTREIYEMAARDSAVQDPWRDLLPWLDLELNRLPEKYRLPVLLCDLQGKTQRQAARQLGLPEGTLSARLSRARAKLAERMARHGIVLTVAALTVALSQQLAAAGSPSDLLVLSTVKAASYLGTAEAAHSGLISPNVAALTSGVLNSMLYAKIKVAAGILLTATAIIASMGGYAHYVRAYGLSHRPEDATRKLAAEIADASKKAALAPFDPMSGSSLGQIRDDNGLGMKLVWCPPGKFMMGSPKSEQNRNPTEAQVQVTLTSGFWLGRTEVTQRQWSHVMATTPWKSEKGFGRGRFENGQLVLDGPITNVAPGVKEGADYPATWLSWEEAVEFCVKLTEEEHEGGRLAPGWEYKLPTDAQWEYACRAGTTTAYSFGNDANRLSDFAWWGGMSGGGNAQFEQYAHRVGLKKPNPWGFYDMHGNVGEWCRDWDGRIAIDSKMPGGTDPVGPANGTWRVCRGASWAQNAGFNRSATRFGLDPAPYRSSDVGFRVALVVSEAIR